MENHHKIHKPFENFAIEDVKKSLLKWFITKIVVKTGISKMNIVIMIQS